MRKEFKKITFVIPSLGSGGAERVVSTLANTFTDKEYQVSVLMTANTHKNYPLSERVQTVMLNCEEKYANAGGAKRYLGRIGDIRKALKELAPDVVISFMSETNIDVCLATMGMKVPVIVSERNDPAIDPASKAKQLLRKLVYIRAKGFVFQTPDAQAYFSKRIQKKSCIIFNPLTMKIHEPYTGVRDNRIVAVGRLNKQKNYPLLLDAFMGFSKKYPEYTLEIYGDGVLENEVKDMIHARNLEDRVHMKGFCKDVHGEIRTAAFYVMSSDFEGMPNALVEAMALGLPCISTDCRCGGPGLLIQNEENGLLVPVKVVAAMEQAMQKLAEDPAFAAQLGAKAVGVKQLVDTQKVTDQWLSYIAQCL